MLVHRLDTLMRSQRGVALPMALLTMLILSALIIAFSMMSASEPMLANNQLQVAQARAVAESGVEQAIWALNNQANANGIPNPLVTPAAPYDGSVATPVMLNGSQLGVFTIAVTNGASANERNIVATGWTPTNTGTGPKVKQRIQVTVSQVHPLTNLPSALTVRGEISVGGHAYIDSRSDATCGNKAGTLSKGSTNVSGSARVYGADGDAVANQSGDVIQNVADSTFDNFSYTNAELDALKAIAKANGTYYSGAQVRTLSFNSSNQMPNGIIYVDTVSGENIDKNGANTTPSTDFALLDIHGNAPLDASGIFSGVLIVAGSLSISGNFQMHGLVYTLNDFTYQGTGTGQIVGAVMSQNVRDVSATTIDADTGGNSTIIWNCNYVRTGGGYIPPTFTIETGTYKEISG
jgi:Tfp pilus assembly protein PilX